MAPKSETRDNRAASQSVSSIKDAKEVYKMPSEGHTLAQTPTVHPKVFLACKGIVHLFPDQIPHTPQLCNCDCPGAAPRHIQPHRIVLVLQCSSTQS